jgi:hypothetical protein
MLTGYSIWLLIKRADAGVTRYSGGAAYLWLACSVSNMAIYFLILSFHILEASRFGSAYVTILFDPSLRLKIAPKKIAKQTKHYRKAYQLCGQVEWTVVASYDCIKQRRQPIGDPSGIKINNEAMVDKRVKPGYETA